MIAECQICLVEKPLMTMPCGHQACLSCLERIFLTTSLRPADAMNSRRRLGQGTDSDENGEKEFLEDCIISSCPTRGRCPFCRTSMSLFDLRGHGHEHEMVSSSWASALVSSSSSSLTNHAGEKQSDMDKDAGGKELGRVFDCMNDTDFARGACPLSGWTFQDRSGKIAVSFPNEKLNVNKDEEDSEVKVGDMDMTYTPRHIHSHRHWPYLKSAQIHEGDKKIYFNTNDCYYHEKSKTFAGSLTWNLDKNSNDDDEDGNGLQEEKEHSNTRNWEVIMQFSSDFRYVAHGAIIKHRPKDTHDRNRSIDYPLDGIWTIRWQKTSDRGVVDRNSLMAAQMRVIDNSFELYGCTYNLNFGDDDSGGGVYFMWDERYFGSGGPAVVQTAESGVDLIHKPDGPDIGETIVWTVDHPDFFRIFWTRESKGGVPPPFDIEYFGIDGGRYGHGHGYNDEYGDTTLLFRQNHIRQSSKPTYHAQTLWGNVFIQALKVGLASYHFISPNAGENDGDGGAYISYENIACSQWPPLDDGSPIPARVPFINISFDIETRTFRGTIPWYDTYGSCWQGCKAWNYEMVFDSKFVCILSGNIQSVTLDGGVGYDHMFGDVLNYRNAAMKDIIIEAADGGAGPGVGSGAGADANVNARTEHSSGIDEDNNVGEGDNDNIKEDYGEREEEVSASTIAGSGSGGQSDDIDPVLKRRLGAGRKIRSRLMEEGATVRTLRLISEGSLGAYDNI